MKSSKCSSQERMTLTRKLKCKPRRASKASAARKLSIILNYVLNLLDYAGMSDILSNACIV